MARLPYVDPADASEEVRAALEAGPQLNVFRLMANAESAYRPWLRWGGALLTGLQLDPVLRELAILRVSALSPGADYEATQHEPIAADAGATDAQIAAVREPDAAQRLEGPAAAVVRFTDEVLRDVGCSDETFAAISAVLSPREIVELIQVIGQYMMLARLMAVAQIDEDGPGDAANVERLRRAASER